MHKAQPRETLAFAMASLALFALYLVMHPYRGVHGDALIYVTRAFAPRAVVEGDMLFAHETQTGLTLFGVLLQGFNALMPVAQAARALALCGVAIWFAGLLLFARSLACAAQLPSRMALAMVALVSVAPLGYSAGSSFTAGEVLAVPRPFAEGFVLMAFAALLAGRRATGISALAAAAAFHPLMGLAGAAVAFAWAALLEKRLWLVALAGVLLALAGAALRTPVLASLLTTFDADWLALLRIRTAYLFLSQAPVSFWVDGLLRGVILFIAARHCAGPVRTFLNAVLVASGLALASSLLFADLLPSILVTQLQPWRVLFVPAVVAPVALMLIAAKGHGRSLRVTLALVACAYMTRDAAILSAGFSLGALALQFNSAWLATATPRVEKIIWIVAAAAWVGFDLVNLAALGQIIADAPQAFVFQWSYLWILRPLTLPLAALAIALGLRARAPRVGFAAAALVLACAMAWLRFDDRAPIDVALESRSAPAILAAMPADERPVLWLSLGKEPWYWLNRPNWVAPVQASSIVFSRDLSMQWSERTRFLIASGVYAPDVFSNQAAPAPRGLSQDAISAVCSRDDAPSAVVAPLRASDPAPEGARRVEAPALSFQWQDSGGPRFETIASYAIWACRQAADISAHGAR